MLCALARGLHNDFQQSALQVLGGALKLPQSAIRAAPVKLPARCAEKVLEYVKENKGFPRSAHILDAVRYSVTCDGAQQILDCIECIRKSPVYTIARVKNKFHHSVDACEFRGYRDVIVNVVFERKGRKIIGEVQLVEKSFMSIKKKSHKLYKIDRSDTIEELRKGYYDVASGR